MTHEIDHYDREVCDECGAPATHHFLSMGFADELAKLEDWEHHKDVCDNCFEKPARVQRLKEKLSKMTEEQLLALERLL